MKPELLIFDVNDTLLDLSVIKERINTLPDNLNAFDDWFSKLIQLAMVKTLTDSYSDFGELGAATLQMTAQKHSKSISEEDITTALSIIKELKPHPEVKEALEKLKSKGFRLVALTNGSSDTLKQQMNFSGLESFFDGFYSVEAVRKFKPHPDAYRYVVVKEKTSSEHAMLIAAHAWDIAGAQHVKMKTAFIKRPGKFPYPQSEQPSLICKDFTDFYEQLVKKV